jgi:exosortase
MKRFRELHVRTALFAALLAALVYGFRQLVFVHAPMTFSDHVEDMSHGWYVPIFSLYVLWRERREILESIGSPSILGVIATLPFLAVGFLGTRGIQVRFEILGFAGLLWSAAWAFFGWRTAKRVLFPAAFLLFCMPLATYLDIVTVHLRLIASSAAFALLKGFGLDIVRRGTMLMSSTGSFAIDVAEPCSGLRSLFALTALTAGYAYFTQPTWLRRAILFALAVPLAIFGNVMRIVTITIVGIACSEDIATGFYHDYSGFVVFLVAIALMVACGRLIDKVASVCKVGERQADGAGAAPCVKARPLVVAACLVAVVPVMLYQAQGSAPVVCEAPRIELGEVPGFELTVLEPGEAELATLPADTSFVKRLYTTPDGAWFQVTVVIGGSSKSSIHRPELCLPSQGFQMTDPRDATAAGADWRFISLLRRDVPPLGFAYTFFNQEGYRTPSHMKRIFRDVWDRSVYNRIDRWVMVTVNAHTADDVAMAAFLERLGESCNFLK